MSRDDLSLCPVCDERWNARMPLNAGGREKYTKIEIIKDYEQVCVNQEHRLVAYFHRESNLLDDSPFK